MVDDVRDSSNFDALASFIEEGSQVVATISSPTMNLSRRPVGFDIIVHLPGKDEAGWLPAVITQVSDPTG